MKQGLLVAVGGAALLIAGLSGCSSGDKSESSSSSSASSESSSAAADAAGGTKVTIDGEDQSLQGKVYCVAAGGVNTITIGEGTSIVSVVLGGDDTTVTTVTLGNINGVALGVGAGQGDATVTKDGKTYTVSGNAVGADITNPTAGIITKPFEITATCP